MHKLPLKKALALSITAISVFAVAIACLFVAPLLDGLINGEGSHLYDFVTVLNSVIYNVTNIFYANEVFPLREWIVFGVAVLSLILFIVWLIALIIKKQGKHLIPFFIAFVGGFGSIFVAAFFLCGNGADGVYLLDWLFAQLVNNVYYGAVILSAVAVALAGIAFLFVVALSIIEIIDLFKLGKEAEGEASDEEVIFEAPNGEEKEAEQETVPEPAPVMAEAKHEEVKRVKATPKEEPKQEKVSSIDREEIRRIIHEECEIVYLKLLRYRLLDIDREENNMSRDDENRRRETDDEYYARMISELGMFNRGRKPAAQPAPQPAPRPVQPAPRVAPQPRPVARPVQPAPAPVAKPKIIRIPFEKRLATVDKTMKAHFNELKSDILAYGVKSRVSNSGDTFRLHTVTYVKITIAGKSLKLYLALDPKDYKDTTLPIADASHKGIYKEIPLVFKVKSELSLRRAKQLIADAMAKGGLEQGPVEAHDWVKDIVKGK